MMGKLIQGKFNQQTETDVGYFVSDLGNEITGVYAGEFSASLEGSEVYAGLKGINTIEDPALLTKQEMNEFCIMWLSLFDPTAIKYDEE